MNKLPIIKLYGSKACHKTAYYQEVLGEFGLPYAFLDVVSSPKYAEELKSLYENNRLNFPTITIGNKKLRNPTRSDLVKWLNKLTPAEFHIM